MGDHCGFCSPEYISQPKHYKILPQTPQKLRKICIIFIHRNIIYTFVPLLKSIGQNILKFSIKTKNFQKSSTEIDPLKEYTIFGNIRQPKKDIWHYSDR